MADNNKNVVGSLRDSIAAQAQRKLEYDMALIEAQRAAAEKLTPSKAQAAWIGSIFAPGAGIADAAGQFPEFPGPDVALEDAFAGDPMPSISENIAAGGIDRYLVAPLQGLGVVGDATYAAPVVGPVLGATVGSVLKGVGALSAVPAAISKAKKTTTGIEALKGTDATKAAIKENLDKFAKDQYGFVSPSLEALLKSAPPNLKGKQITEWLAANANKGVKPKELEYLGIDEFVATNPKASINEVVEGVSDNKVVVGKNTYFHNADAPEIDFDISNPEFDPLDSSYPNYQSKYEDVTEYIKLGDEYETEELLDFFNQSNPQAGAKTISDVDNYLSARNESLDDLIKSYAKEQYFENPYELIKPKSTNQVYDVDIPDDTFAFGNDEVGYQLFVGGERVTDPDNIAFSRTEAQIQLSNKMEEGGDPLRIAGSGDDMLTEARYKQYVDETLPGGDNYREVVFTWENAPVEHGVQDHFDELSQISSALIRNRKLADGKKTLHVDELQSDLHTTGSKRGYTPSKSEQIKMEEELEKILPDGYYASDGYIFDEFDEVVSTYLKNVPSRPEHRLMFTQAMGSKNGDKFFEIIDRFGDTPNYPFKDDWYAMSLKQLLKDAIDEGADAISVSSSAPIKARYTDEYSKFYETLYDQKIPSAMKKLANKYGGKFEKGNLDEYDIYGSLLDDVRKGDPDAIDNLLGLYGERFGGGVDDINEVMETLPKLAETNIIRITPEMKAKILEEGLPSFAFGGPVFKPFSIDNIDIFNP